METIHIRKDTRGRRGKSVMILEGFTRRPEEIEELARRIKSALGVGGSVKNGHIEIQGELQEQVAAILHKLGFQVKSP